MPNAPLKHVAGSTVTTVVDPRFGVGPSPVQPPGWTSGGGGTSVGTTGDIIGQGFHVPPGALANLASGLANHTTERVEIAYFGDSTGDGSGSNFGEGGPPRKLRDLLHAAGITDGGRGHLRYPTEDYDPDHVVTRTGWNLTARVDDWPPNGGAASDTAGDVITGQGRGTAVRLHFGNADNITYSVDGGSAVPVATGTSTVYIGGLTEGVHEVTVTKTSGTVRSFVAFEFIRDAGVIVHQDAVSGRTSGSYANARKAVETATAGSNSATQRFGLGITPTTTNGPPDYASTPSTARPNGARNIKAAIFALGVNDMSLVTNEDIYAEGSVAASTLAENASQFVRLCRAANADPIIVVPHLLWDPRGWRIAGRFKAALVSVAEANGAAWCDYETALRQAGYAIDQNPHRPQVEYDVEAQFLFDNVISLALPEA